MLRLRCRKGLGTATAFSLVSGVTMINFFLFIFGLALIALGLWGGKIVPPRPVDSRMAAGL
jgi:hypothetical protein